MKKTITILLALVMVLSLAACGGGSNSSDKKRLVGDWYVESSSTVNTAIGVIGVKSTSWYYFHENNKFYYSKVSNDYLSGPEGWIPIGAQEYNTYSGTYRIKDGIISLTYENSDGATETEEIPYYINEYTKELIFYVDKNGNSEWKKWSDKPSVPVEDQKEDDKPSTSTTTSAPAKAG